MFFGVTFLVLLTSQLYEIHSQSACMPNTYIALNDRLCFCDHQGRLNEANCKKIARRQSCPPGQVIWQGCNQCICQDNGQLKCISAFCPNRVSKPGISYHGLAEYGSRCTPFKSYYVNCSLCFCPASGQATDAHCAADASCSLGQTSDIMTLTKRNQCIPNVIYLFPCIQCLCSEYGHFILDKCLEKCQSQIKHQRRCIPGTLYRSDCDVCRCPDNSIPDENLCIKNGCNANTKQAYLHSLRSSSNHCTPRSFTKPKCIYCDCSTEGTVNERSCLELDCLKVSDFKHHTETEACSPGELVPICMECFCLNNGLTNETYCTRVCTYQNKLKVLEKVLNDSKVDLRLIDKTKVKTVGRGESCEPSTLYLDDSKYCLCPDNGDTNFKLCTNVIEESKYEHLESNKLKFDTDISCEPSTLVDFDCNTCYCSKDGKIDPKWCTYDDCEAKRIVMESHKTHRNSNLTKDLNEACIPGSISKVKCNFCICPESGVLKERACTKNECYGSVEETNGRFFCEPLAYYEVDCNICFCPSDGLKNVAKCTKNQCEKTFLRTEACIPGHLFSDECNVCVCPPDGNKADRVCTNNTCSLPRWSAFKLTDGFLANEVLQDTTRNLDLCYPGEEFSVGCNVCVCPDLGLKVYATCEPLLCDKEEDMKSTDDYLDRKDKLDETTTELVNHRNVGFRAKRDAHDKCFIYNVSSSAERKECTPGTMYIIRCKQCICPYVGNINNFCRPLPKTFYCEQAFPGFNYLPMGRRIVEKKNTTTGQSSTKESNNSVTVTVKHLKHTTYKCDKPGKVIDECFICDCEDNVVIEEHCFKSDAKNCFNATPTFFDVNKAINFLFTFHLKLKLINLKLILAMFDENRSKTAATKWQITIIMINYKSKIAASTKWRITFFKFHMSGVF